MSDLEKKDMNRAAGHFKDPMQPTAITAMTSQCISDFNCIWDWFPNNHIVEPLCFNDLPIFYSSGYWRWFRVSFWILLLWKVQLPHWHNFCIQGHAGAVWTVPSLWEPQCQLPFYQWLALPQHCNIRSGDLGGYWGSSQPCAFPKPVCRSIIWTCYVHNYVFSYGWPAHLVYTKGKCVYVIPKCCALAVTDNGRSFSLYVWLKGKVQWSARSCAVKLWLPVVCSLAQWDLQWQTLREYQQKERDQYVARLRMTQLDSRNLYVSWSMLLEGPDLKYSIMQFNMMQWNYSAFKIVCISIMCHSPAL